MKKEKIKLTDLKINSFVTGESSKLKGGRPGYTFDCALVPLSDSCPTEHKYGCQASIELLCSATLARIDCL